MRIFARAYNRYFIAPKLPALALMLKSVSAVAYDEIQVYDMGINQLGQFALEMHSNYVINGRRQPGYPGELPPDGQLAFTPEFSYGWSKHLELGLYVPMSINPNTASSMFDDAKMRLKWLNADDPRPLQRRLADCLQSFARAGLDRPKPDAGTVARLEGYSSGFRQGSCRHRALRRFRPA
jgi:hypothetical protein